jgi:uncharacterized membrane protein YciS (DUF1049 family)
MTEVRGQKSVVSKNATLSAMLFALGFDCDAILKCACFVPVVLTNRNNYRQRRGERSTVFL